MKLFEQFLSQGKVIEANKEKLPEGILCRATYQICSIGEKNRNNRVYGREVWEHVLGDKEISEKLKNRSLFFHAEHPSTTQSNTEKVAGVVTDVNVNEGEKKVYAVMEVLDTPYGRIVDTLLRAGCGIGVSTRADGELEEALDEDGHKYHRVIPESYRFVTIDFTADPSTYGSEMPVSVERDVTGVIKNGLDNEKIDRDYAAVLLERMKAPEAVALLESLRIDQHHKDCKCKASEKKCGKGCPHSVVHPLIVGTRIKFENKEGTISSVLSEKKEYVVKVGEVSENISFDKVLEILLPVGFDSGSDGFARCEKCGGYVQFPDQKLCQKCSSAMEVPEAKASTPGATKDTAAAVVNRDDKQFKQDAKDPNESALISPRIPESFKVGLPVKVNERNGIVSHIFPRTGKCIVQFADVKETRKIEECIPLAAEKMTSSADVTGQPANATAAAEVVKKSAAVETTQPEKKIEEDVQMVMDIAPKIQQFLADNWKMFLNNQDAVKNVSRVFKISDADANNYVEKAESGLGKISAVYAMSNESVSQAVKELREKVDVTVSEKKKVIESYANDVVGLSKKINEVTAENKNNIIIIEALVLEKKDLIREKGTLLSEMNSLKEQIGSVTEKLNTANGLISTQNNVLDADVKKIAELSESLTKSNKDNVDLKEKYEAQVKQLNEAHKSELMKLYVSSKLQSMSLRLPKQFLTILESCTATEEVDASIVKIQDQLREGILQFGSLPEIVVAGQPIDARQADINQKIAIVLKNFGV